MERIKVVWFCYYSNHFVQNKIKPWKQVGEIAPWISNLIPLFENNDSVELHIVSLHEWISAYKHFKNEGIHYHFFNKGIPFIGRHWPGFFRFDIWTDFFFIRKRFTRIVNIVNPDIIHLHGAENEFSTVIKQFHARYPVFITIQGFIHKATSNGTKSMKYRIKNEMAILKMFRDYGYRTETMGHEIQSINPKSVLHWHGYPIKTIKPRATEKLFDIVFFARVSKDKGIEDLLKAVSIIKKEKPDISLYVIGGGKTDLFQKLALELGIQKNVHWAGFLESQDEVHKLVASARVSVLPTYHDIISGTIIESLFLELPVVAYNVGSIYEINKSEDIVFLVEKGDIQSLAEKILLILNDPALQKEIGKKGRERALKMFPNSNDKIKEDLLGAYQKVITAF